MLRYLSFIASIVLLIPCIMHAQDGGGTPVPRPESGRGAGPERDSLRYIVKMESGDAFRGNLIGYTDTTVTIQTEFGTVTIAKRLISEFIPLEGPYRRRPNHFLMPSASPNGPGGFISNYELGFLYGGFGLGYGATVSMGATLVPTVSLRSQLYHIGAKFTIERSADYELAVGAAYSFLTLDYPYAHIYGVGTFPFGSGRYSVMVFYRASGQETAPIALQAFSSDESDTTRFTVHYDGSLGAAVGFDAPAFGRDDMSWVGEIWNNDLTKPQNTVSLLAIRVTNEHLSADFGLALFSQPFVVPVTSFTWRF
jgi:hypothetical protein